MSMLEQYFEENILNKDFEITYADDEGAIRTADYAGYVFLLRKGADYYHGPLIVSKGNEKYTGEWSCNDDYGKLTIALPASPEAFKFLNREWRFTSKNIPVLKFAPWGSDAKIALTMERK